MIYLITDSGVKSARTFKEFNNKYHVLLEESECASCGGDFVSYATNNDLDFLRYKVNKLGYKIVDEELVKDAGIIYTVIKFKKGIKFYTKKQLYFGPLLMKEKSELFYERCNTEFDKMVKFYPVIPKGQIHHRNKIKWRIKTLEKILEDK